MIGRARMGRMEYLERVFGYNSMNEQINIC